MSFVRFDSEGCLIDRDDNRIHMVGINYVASYICTNFWEDWRPEVIGKDLARIAELGLTAVRIPMHWGYMEPEQGKYNDSFFEKFDLFLEMCRKNGLYVMPWFLVGVATRDYDVPFRNGRPFFTGEMVTAAENHLKHFIAPYQEEEQILFWDICDEPEWYSRHPGAEQLPFHREPVVRWVKNMYEAIRSVDPNHLITLGFGHIATANYGMDVRDMAKALDLMVVTAYPGWADEGIDTARNNYTLPFHVKMNSRGKPVFTCEAPGHSSILYSEAMVGRYFKTSLYSNLINGSTGVLPWVYNDFAEELWHKVPLEQYLIEPNFGIVTVDGRLKPSGRELRDYAAFAKKADIGKYRPQKAEAAVLVPEGYYAYINTACEKIYTACLLGKGCGIDVDLVWTTEELNSYKLLLLPTAAGMTTSAWDKVRSFVEAGGILYHTYESGAQNAYFNRLFGVEAETQEADYGYRQMCAEQSWGAFKKGDTIPFTGKNRNYVLRVKEEQAEVLSTFEDGKAAFMRNHYGKGTAYLAVLPLDNGLMKISYEEFLNTRSFALLDNMIEEAGISRFFRFDHPAIEVGCMENGSTGEQMVICINHDKNPVHTELTLDRTQLPEQWEIRDYETEEILLEDQKEVSFAPAEVHIYKITPIINEK